MAKKKHSAVRNNIETFLPAYLLAADQNITLEDFAASMGITPLTVDQRIGNLQNRLKIDLPRLAGRGRISLEDKALAILNQYSKAKKASKNTR